MPKSKTRFILQAGCIFLLLLFPIGIFAGTTGKIAGVIKDKGTGEPLAGANILIVGTHLGAASDLQGNYFIISIPPGEYTLKATMMGYATMEVKNVKVRIDQTTRIEISLQEQVVDLGESVTVVAERPVIQKDLTSSVEVVDLEQMKQSTATSVEQAVNLQTGVYFDPIAIEGNLSGLGRGEPRYSVRGGDQDEVIWFIDGTRSAAMAEAKADAGGSFTRINIEAVQEIEVITGGFNAEYGQAQSGIVNIISKEGSQDYSLSVDYQYGPPHQRHFGNYLYDQNKNIEFIKNTLVDSTTGASYLDPQWWTPDRQKQVFDYRHFADHEFRFSFGGPVPGAFIPLIGNELDKMTFFLTGRLQQQAYELPRPRDARKLADFNLSGKYAVKPGLNIKFGGMYSHDAHATNGEESFPYFAKYYRGYGSLLDNYIYQARLGLIHIVKPEMFYEIKLSSYTLRQKEAPSPFRIPGESLKPDIWGWHRYDGFEDEPFIAHLFSPKSNNVTGDLSLLSHFSWQVNNNNLLKAGLEFHYNTYDEDNWILSEFSDSLKYWRVRGLNETYHPLQFGIYFQDKMEFESMILNMGVRYDYYDGNRDWFTKDSFVWNPALDPAYQPSADPDKDGIDSLGHKKWDFQNVLNKPRQRVAPFHSINPRLGISFPITDKTVFHFSYGHFYQMPAINSQYDFVYFRPVPIAKGAPPTDTDPERAINLTLEPLKPEKTIQFELGVKHEFKRMAVLNITGFYKDMFDQVERAEFLDRRIYGINPYTNNESNVFYSSRFSGDYADARGIEVTLRTLFSNHFVLDFNYSFSKSAQGKATPTQIHIDKEGNATYKWYVEAVDRLPVEKSYSRPHVLRANIFMQYPPQWNLPVLKPIFQNSDLSLLFNFISGQAFTYLKPDDPPDLLDNQRFPARQTWDLKFNKYFNLGQHTFTFYTKITNLFNQKNIRAWGNLFDVDALDKFVKTGKPTSLDPDGYDISYSIYHAPRSVWFGVRYSFR